MYSWMERIRRDKTQTTQNWKRRTLCTIGNTVKETLVLIFRTYTLWPRVILSCRCLSLIIVDFETIDRMIYLLASNWENSDRILFPIFLLLHRVVICEREGKKFHVIVINFRTQRSSLSFYLIPMRIIFFLLKNDCLFSPSHPHFHVCLFCFVFSKKTFNALLRFIFYLLTK